MAKLREELDELHEAVESGKGAAIAEELGDLMFSAVNLARFRGFDPEVLMAQANAKFEARFHEMERLLRKRGKTLEAASTEQMEAAWEEAKREVD